MSKAKCCGGEALRSLRLDARRPEARAQLGYVLLFKGQHDAAIAEFERAFGLNPNFIDYRYASALTYAGEPARAIEVLESSIRLDPFQPLLFAVSSRGMANYTLKRYGEAVRLYRECALRAPNLRWPHLALACAYAQSGWLEDARKEAAEVLRINPSFTIESWKRLVVYKDPKDAEHRVDGARKAGCLRLELTPHSAPLPRLSKQIITQAANRAIHRTLGEYDGSFGS